ncbi:MAG: quinolinate synthase NadA [Candidatus Omnitrophica bacterium]|nr:quinolinate synthase NadA [Candidatus Omnitrophota bacterium]MCM8831213.1 quinolinate synthase NadA [Candidatus Omnitrophota bacterium]
MSNSSLVKKISELKKDRNAIILVHNYQPPEVQDIADFLGDSLELSIKAAQTDAKVIVFCGVHFMAETASILCPDKTVLMPDINAGCPMANMIDAKQLKKLKIEHPEAIVVAYVNTTAEVKAESDICCTSSNAIKVVQSQDKDKEIIFVPDKYLGQYVTYMTQREMIYWEGYCPVHVKILAEDIVKLKKEHPDAEVIVHPECTPQVIKLADRVLSTGGMCRYAKETTAKKIIVGTEIGIIYRLQKENPDKKFYPASELAICPNMKLGSLEKVLWVLEELKNEVKVPKEIQVKAIKPIKRMLSIT